MSEIRNGRLGSSLFWAVTFSDVYLYCRIRSWVPAYSRCNWTLPRRYRSSRWTLRVLKVLWKISTMNWRSPIVDWGHCNMSCYRERRSSDSHQPTSSHLVKIVSPSVTRSLVVVKLFSHMHSYIHSTFVWSANLPWSASFPNISLRKTLGITGAWPHNHLSFISVISFLHDDTLLCILGGGVG